MNYRDQNQDKVIKQAISAWVDGEATREEKELAERSIRENSVYSKYAAELKQLTFSLKCWEAEDPSPDLLVRLQNLKEREGFSMKNLFSSFNFKIAGGLVAAVLAVVVVVHYPEVMQKEQQDKKGMLQRDYEVRGPVESLKASVMAKKNAAEDAKLSVPELAREHKFVVAQERVPRSVASPIVARSEVRLPCFMKRPIE